jgi:hypothetical protein
VMYTSSPPKDTPNQWTQRTHRKWKEISSECNKLKIGHRDPWNVKWVNHALCADLQPEKYLLRRQKNRKTLWHLQT